MLTPANLLSLCWGGGGGTSAPVCEQRNGAEKQEISSRGFRVQSFSFDTYSVNT